MIFSEFKKVELSKDEQKYYKEKDNSYDFFENNVKSSLAFVPYEIDMYQLEKLVEITKKHILYRTHRPITVEINRNSSKSFCMSTETAGMPDIISIGIKNLYQEFDDQRIARFIKGLGIEVNTYSVFLIYLLHEFGHHVFIGEYFKDDKQQRYHMFSLKEILNGLFKIPKKANNAKGVMKRVYMYPDELFSDRFAFENFYPIWLEFESTSCSVYVHKYIRR